MSNAKLIWSRRDMGILRSRKHDFAYRRMADLPDKVFAVSEQVRRHSVEVDGIDPARVETIYNGLDLSDWSEVSRPSRANCETVIVTVGNIRRVKGHDILIRAAASVLRRFPQAGFRIGGDILDADYFAELQELIRSLNLSDQVQFSGGVSNLCTYLSEADIFLLPSRSEGFSNAIIEAMAAGLPVVATDVGGNAEAVEHGVTGLIIPAENSDALAAAIESLMSDPSRARAMGAAGRTMAADRFTTEAMMTRIKNAYGNLLASR
jgi:glycosyltransferase involved in cell wall biosynthesis